MRSEIKIDFIDRGTGAGIEPVIRVELKPSEDPRDKLVQTLFQSIRGGHLLQFTYSNQIATSTPEGNPAMEKRILLFKPEEQWVNVHDNSDGFRALLDKQNIKWKSNEHSTLIEPNVDFFELGRAVEKAKTAAK